MTSSLTFAAVYGGAGVLLGLAAHLVIAVGFDPAKAKSGRAGQPDRIRLTAFRAGLFGARLVFIYGTYH
jgi:hypothetical protein